MTYEEAVAYLEGFVNYERTHEPEAMRAVKLERMQELCRRVGDPQRRFRSILVTGTNGKGSICALLYAMLRESPLRVGLYTSPHLEHLRERIRTSPSTGTGHADDWIEAQEFAALIEQLQPALEQMRRARPEQPPTYFEILTAAAFLCFNQRQVEVAILEVGLGGRLDATNVVEQAVSVIGAIDVDHADVLGPDPESIAREKAGIIKPHQTVITVPQSEAVMAVLRSACEAQGVALLTCGRDITVQIQQHDLSGLRLCVTGARGIYDSLQLPLVGRHQAQNAAVAVAALEALSEIGMPFSLVERGLSNVEWPGRLEIVSDTPLVVMDGAHNPQAAEALAQTLTELCGGRTIHLLIGMSADKSIEAIGRRLGKLAISATCTKSRHARALDPVELAQRLAPLCPDVHVMSDPVDAYTYLLNVVSSQDAIVVTGSLFLVGQLRAALRHAHVRPPKPALVEA